MVGVWICMTFAANAIGDSINPNITVWLLRVGGRFDPTLPIKLGVGSWVTSNPHSASDDGRAVQE